MKKIVSVIFIWLFVYSFVMNAIMLISAFIENDTKNILISSFLLSGLITIYILNKEK